MQKSLKDVHVSSRHCTLVRGEKLNMNCIKNKYILKEKCCLSLKEHFPTLVFVNKSIDVQLVKALPVCEQQQPGWTL